MGIEGLARELENLQMAQQQRSMAQQGLAGGLLSGIANSQLGAAVISTGDWGTWDSTATTDIDTSFTKDVVPFNQDGRLMSPVAYHKVKNRIFYRINQKIELREGEAIKEPLDELRIEVSKWLN